MSLTSLPTQRAILHRLADLEHDLQEYLRVKSPWEFVIDLIFENPSGSLRGRRAVALPLPPDAPEGAEPQTYIEEVPLSQVRFRLAPLPDHVIEVNGALYDRAKHTRRPLELQR